MEQYLNRLPPKIKRIIRDITAEAEALSLEAFLVGGIVRDCILQRKNLDVDIVIEGDAGELAQVLSRKWKCPLTQHKQFRTATLNYDNLIVDLASARQETYAQPGALPQVRRGTLEQDLWRRDFTINALAICITGRHKGYLIDILGGLRDLTYGVINVMHADSFLDDPTRILRAIRFRSRFHFRLNLFTAQLMRAALKKKVERTVKPARYFNEFKKVLQEENPLLVMQELGKLGALNFIGNDYHFRATLMKTALQFFQGQQMQIWMKNSQFKHRWLVFFMTMITCFDQNEISQMADKFHFTKEEKKSILESLDRKKVLKALSAKDIKWSRVHRLLKVYSLPFLVFLRATTHSKPVQERLTWFLQNCDRIKLKVTGHDLLALGVPAGDRIGEVLQRILDQKIDASLKTKRDEINFLKTIL